MRDSVEIKQSRSNRGFNAKCFANKKVEEQENIQYIHSMCIGIRGLSTVTFHNENGGVEWKMLKKQSFQWNV